MLECIEWRLSGAMLDIMIVGRGPAGLSAAITARQRDKTAVVISNDAAHSGLFKAREVGNYPGLPKISGPELLQKLASHASEVGARLITGRVSVIMMVSGSFSVGYGTEILSAKSVILATGVAQTSYFPGEEEFLGSGVSYCATCDGMLFRGKKVCVVCLSPEADDEADYLSSIGCDVVRLRTKDVRINGENRVASVTADGEEIECEGVFVLRPAIAPQLMLSGLETADGHIKTDRRGETSVRGVFAAGDCVGAPYQVAKAVGEGQIAALSASEYISRL